MSDDYTPIISTVEDHARTTARTTDLQAMLDAIHAGDRAFLSVDGCECAPLEIRQATAAAIVRLTLVDEEAKRDQLQQKLQRMKESQ